MKNKISASIMCANLLNLSKDIKKLEKANVDYIHWDIMDGSFVNNFSMNQHLIKAARNITDIEFDTHLMINNPERYINEFIEAGSNILVIHPETTSHLYKAIYQIKEKGAKVGLAISPGTHLITVIDLLEEIDMLLIMTVIPGFSGQKMIPLTLDKIKKAKKIIENKKLNIDIQVDGNVSFKNMKIMKNYGANIFVAGTSSIFSKDCSIIEGVDKMRKIITE